MVARAERHGAGERVLHTRAGLVRVHVDEARTATLVSVEPRVEDLPEDQLDRLLATLGWHRGELDPSLPPALAYAGAWHPVIAASTRGRLGRLDYAFDDLASLMAQHHWTTVNLVWRENAQVFHARNPFPPGGVVEDPATGAAAAALGAYVAARHALPADRRFRVRQGEDMGRPSLLDVEVPAAPGAGIRVSGTAARIAATSG